MEDLIARFGLVAICLGATIEGDVILILAGVTAHLGLVSLPLAMGAGATGCFTGDLAWYLVGRHRSSAIRETRVYGAIGPTVERIASRIGPWQITSSRLIYGTRIATMLYWGVRRLPLPTFVLIDLAGCAVWATLLGAVGYGASSGAMLLIGEVKRVELWLLGAVAGSLLAFLAIRVVFARTRPAREADR
jgi:membrane protein DedA with SNARE-associated domain